MAQSVNGQGGLSVAAARGMAGVARLDELAAEINALTARTVANMIAIGKRLSEAKEQVAYGEWERWLSVNIGYSHATASKLMLMYREYPTGDAPALPASKLYELLALPSSEREKFLAETHEADGRVVAVESMTVRQLHQAIARRKAREMEQDEELKRKRQEILRLRQEAGDKGGRIAALERERDEMLRQQSQTLAELAAVESREAELKREMEAVTSDAGAILETKEIEVPPADYDALLRENAQSFAARVRLSEERDELERKAMRLERRLAALDELRRAAQDGEVAIAPKFREAVNEFVEGFAPLATRADYSTASNAVNKAYSDALRRLELFCAAMRARMNGVYIATEEEEDAEMDG